MMTTTMRSTMMISNNTGPRTPADLIAKHDEAGHSDLAVPPGEYLEEVISEIVVNKTELAAQPCLSTVEMDALLTGNLPISDLSERLQKATNVPANIWLGLESEYRLALARELEEALLREDG